MPNKHCELFQVRQVVGEKEVRVVERTACKVPCCAIPVQKILNVTVAVMDTTDLLLCHNVVKEGVFEVGITFAGCDGLVRYTTTAVPFMVEAATIVKTMPGMTAQNELLCLEENTTLVTEEPEPGVICQVFDIKIVALFSIKVTKEGERYLKQCCPKSRFKKGSTYSTKNAAQ